MNLFLYRARIAAILLLLTLRLPQAGAQSTFMPGRSIAVAKAGPGDTTAAYTIYTSDNVLNPTAFSAAATFNNGWDLNGFGYNQLDSLLYGAAYTGDTMLAGTVLNVNLYRLDATGQLRNLGKLPTSGQSPTVTLLGGIRAEIPNYMAGFVDSNGRYYYLTMGFVNTGIEKLANGWSAYKFGGIMNPNPGLALNDVRIYLCWINNVQLLDSTNMPLTVAGYRKIDFSDPDVSGAVQLLLDDMNADFPRVGHLNGGIPDFARNPADKKLYGYISYPVGDTASDSVAGRPVVFVTGTAANTLVIQPVGTVENLAPQSPMAGLNFDSTGQMFCLFNNGKYGRADLTSGALSGLSQSNLPIASGLLWGDMTGIAQEGFLPPEPATITVSTLNNVPAEITIAGGNLQMTAAILPADASQSVEWSVFEVDGQASVDNAGNVTAIADGTVYIKAMATGYPDIADSMAVLISHEDTTTGIGQGHTASSSVIVYPNPVTQKLSIKNTAGDAIHTVTITDMTGRQMLRRTYSKNRQAAITELDLAWLGNGIYLLQATGDHFNAVARFVIQHAQ